MQVIQAARLVHTHNTLKHTHILDRDTHSYTHTCARTHAHTHIHTHAGNASYQAGVIGHVGIDFVTLQEEGSGALRLWAVDAGECVYVCVHVCRCGYVLMWTSLQV
jgi:hypothetical protein